MKDSAVVWQEDSRSDSKERHKCEVRLSAVSKVAVGLMVNGYLFLFVT